MCHKKFFGANILHFGLIALLFLIILPETAVAQGTTDAGTLSGYVFEVNQESPVKNAIVRIRRIGDDKEYESNSTDEYGFFEIQGIEEGRYILGVELGGERFNFDYSVLIKGNEVAYLPLGLKPGAADDPDAQVEDNVMRERDVAFFPDPGGRAVFDSTIADSVFVLYGYVRLPPFPISPWMPGRPPWWPGKPPWVPPGRGRGVRR